MDDYRRLLAWCLVLTIGVTMLLLWFLPGIALGIIMLMLIVSCFEGYFLREASLQAKARDEQCFRNSTFSARPERFPVQFQDEEDEWIIP